MGYSILRCDSYSRFTGGVLLYIKNEISTNVILNKCFDNNLWSLCVNVKDHKFKARITVIYHSPSASCAIFLRYLQQLFDSIINLEKTNIIFGDFNIDISKDTYYSGALATQVQNASLKQLVNFFTRKTPTSKTIIDLVLTNCQKILVKCEDDAKISDHETLNIKFCDSEKQNCDIYKDIVSWKNYTKDNLCFLLNYIDWSPFYYCDIHQKLSFICEVLSESVKKINNKENN